MLAVITTLATASSVDASFCAATNWEQVWSDEFEGQALNTSKWRIRETQHGTGGASVDRRAKVVADDVYLESGALVLRTQKRKTFDGYNFTSGAVDTRWMHSWSGLTRVCVRAKLPGGGGGGRGQGIQPAHWLMPDNKACWPSNGEIDILEMFNGDGKAFGTYIYKAFGCNRPDHAIGNWTSPGSDWATAFHEYAVEYDGKGHVRFVVDGTVYNDVTSAKFFDVPYYAILDTSVGSARAGPPNASTAFPTYHFIDYVRVAQPRSGAVSAPGATRDEEEAVS